MRPFDYGTEEKKATKVTEDYIRPSIDLEDIQDIIDDIDRALRKTV